MGGGESRDGLGGYRSGPREVQRHRLGRHEAETPWQMPPTGLASGLEGSPETIGRNENDIKDFEDTLC